MNSYFFILTVVQLIQLCATHSDRTVVQLSSTSLRDTARSTCTRACYLQLSDEKCWQKTFTFFTHAFLNDLTDYYQTWPTQFNDALSEEDDDRAAVALDKFEDEWFGRLLMQMAHRKIPALNDTMLQVFEKIKSTIRSIERHDAQSFSRKNHQQYFYNDENHHKNDKPLVMKCPAEDVCKESIKDRVDYYKKLTWIFGLLSPFSLVLLFFIHFFTNQKLKKYNWNLQMILKIYTKK